MEHVKIERLRDRMLSCPICMDEYKDPRILPCHHTVCLNCLLDFVQISSSSGRLFRCPQCRADVCVPRGGVKDFPPNFYINCIQDELGSKPYVGSCDVCERDWLTSQYRCIDCDMDICKFCVHDHRLFKHMTGRPASIIRIEDGNVGPCLTSQRSCEVHKDEQLQMFCLNCDIAICVTCVCDEHRKHHTMTLAKKFSLAQKHLNFDLDQLQVDTQNVKDELKLLRNIEISTDKATDSAVFDIREHTKSVIDTVSEIAENKIEKVKNERRKLVKEIRDYETDLSALLDQLQRGCTFLDDVQVDDMCLELLSCFQKYRGLLESAKNPITNKEIRQNIVTFKPGSVVNRFGYFGVGRGKLQLEKRVFTFQEKATKRRQVRKFIRERIPVWAMRLFTSVIAVCVMIGMVLLTIGVYNEASSDNIVCLVMYLYISIAGLFAIRKR